MERYAEAARLARQIQVEPEAMEEGGLLPEPRPWQVHALAKLAEIRTRGYRRALVAVATGLGKTWLSAFDLVAFGRGLGRRPRVLAVAHRSEILVQLEGVLRHALDSEWPGTEVSWCLKSTSDLDGDLVIASVQKLTRLEGLESLAAQAFDYVVIDEVHHAQAPSYRKLMARVNASFMLGLTATPERADGVDVAVLFDDILAWQATIGDGIEEGSLVPFHYVGVRDTVDFAQIPWRNGRFDPGVLEERVENSARMERLWLAWGEHPATKTIVFCCSRRHALFTRDWLRSRGVKAAAIFSGLGGDPRADSLTALLAGELDALCVVDLFNEGVNLPSVDRVVMLRPTESKVIFVQQLGRGLRASADKARLVVIDFVGNHRVFAQRLIHLLALNRGESNWTQLAKVLEGAEPDLPPGCLLDIELEARDLLRALLPAGGGAVEEAYLAMRDELGRRPAMAELFHRGYLPSTLRARHDDWFSFLKNKGDLLPEEVNALDEFQPWLRMLETTALFRSFKMVVLRTLLDWDAFWSGMPLAELAKACRQFLTRHDVLRADLKPTREIPDHATASDADWAKWWRAWPVDRWLAEQSGRVWFKMEGDRLRFAPDCPAALRPVLEAMTGELVDYRLAQYVSSRHGTTVAVSQFTAKVSHVQGKPILFLPSREQFPGLPLGPIDVELPGGVTWVFRFVKIACNVAAPRGETRNCLPELLRGWFGETAGLPGTGFNVSFVLNERGWQAAPALPAARLGGGVTEQTSVDHVPPKFELLDSPPVAERYISCVPVYNLEAAAGLWGPDHSPEELGWLQIPKSRLGPGMFVARVCGHSMEPKIPNDSWCLFRPCPAGSREGRVVLVQFHSMSDPENGGRYTLKKYHSTKASADGGWEHAAIQLQPLNPAYAAIEVHPLEAPELLLVGEFVEVVG